MPVVRSTIMSLDQFGGAHNGTHTYQPSDGNDVNPGKSIIARFSNIDIPRGSTINEVYFAFWITSKFPDQNASVTVQWLFENGPSEPLRTGKQEDLDRVWTHMWTGGIVYNANSGSHQQQVLHFTPSMIQSMVGQSWWTQPGTITLRIYCDAESGDISISRYNGSNGEPAYIYVDYTPPASIPATPVVNYADNANFNLNAIDTPANPYAWRHNSWWGTFPVAPTYQVGSTIDGLSAPNGGNIVKITMPSDGVASIARDAMNVAGTYGLAPGWYTASVWAYVPSSVNTSVVVTEGSTSTGGLNTGTFKNVWVKIHSNMIVTNDTGNPLIFIRTEDALAAGQSIYIANFSYTPGRLSPNKAFGTNTATHTYKYIGGATGAGTVVEAPTPSATVTSLKDTTMVGGTTVEWLYSGAAAPQTQYVLEWRKL